MNTSVARKNLLSFCTTLSEINVDYFITDGTLLGFIREGGFIEWDQDIDIGMLAEDFDWKIVNKLVKRGFDIYYTFGRVNKGLEISFMRNGIKIDLFLYYLNHDKKTRTSHAWLNGGRRGKTDMLTYEYPEEVFRKFEYLKNHNALYRKVADHELFLKLKYGDWKTPVRNWNWAFGPKNRI